MATLKEVLNRGDLNLLAPVFKAGQLGTLLAGEGDLRLVREIVPVATNACAPTYTCKRLLSCKVSLGSTGNGEKEPMANGDVALRDITESALPVATAAATPSFPIRQLLHARTIGTGAAAIKTPLINGASPSAGQAAPNAAGTSIAFNAETTGTGTADVSYLTAAGCATPNAGGTSIAFTASEVTGANAVAELLYLTSDPPKDANGVASNALSATVAGIG